MEDLPDLNIFFKKSLYFGGYFIRFKENMKEKFIRIRFKENEQCERRVY